MAQGNFLADVTLKFWHGGCFKMDGNSLVYQGRNFRTVSLDPDEMGWFTLIEEAEKCGFKRGVDAVFFMIPNEGLRRAFDDRDAQFMCTLAELHRVVECYIILDKDVAQLMQWIEVIDNAVVVNKPSKLVPRRKGDVKKASVEKDAAVQKEGPPESSSSFITQKEAPLSSHKSTSLSAEKNPKKTLKSPKKCSRPKSPAIRTSPRIASKQNILEKSSEKTAPTVEHLQPQNTEEIVPQIPQKLSDHPSSSFHFNDITLADLYDEYEERADKACLNCNEGLSDLSEGEETDPGYEPEEDAGESDDEDDKSEEDEVLLEDDLNDIDFHDDELHEARVKLLAWNANALKIANQVQLEAASGKLTAQESLTVPNSSNKVEVHLSDYDESGDEEDTPGESDEESIPGKRKSASIPVVNERTDYLKLKWCVGIRFPNTDLFREAVIRYAVAQGRDLTFDISDKARGKKLRVRCKKGCPFKLYGSWDNKLAAFLVKTVDPHHTCQRTMESNRQLKSTWLAKQFLDVFKAKPHWPAKDIIDTVRRAYKVIIKKDIAYKVKYHAHKLLHGSMKEHYSKLGSYIAALEQGNPTSVFTLYTNPNISTNPAVFQRLFVCFDALKQGWLLGCRKILCVDACFLKTFLGGQLIAVIGRDGNEQMFPLAWAVVEGENNESYEWFFQQLKSSLGEADGQGWTFISDQHQSILTMIAKEFPRAEHRHCARHIFANWHKTYKGDEMKLLFWNCAKAYNEADFDDALQAIREVDHKVL
ncbi:uncharacterized protein LOC141595710 [Silene latifolia]|uniref:uncharacterized protein LOC141595710 n=1 Tax=Silene latifolia TaxID=37657 RepID=UPI003D7717C4